MPPALIGAEHLHTGGVEAIQEYATGFIDITPNRGPIRLLRGAGWEAELRPPSARLAAVGDGAEVVLRCANVRTAAKALHLIAAAVDLLLGQPTLFDTSWDPRSTTDRALRERDEAMFSTSEKTFATTDVWFGCRIAAKASRKSKWHYAIIKHAFSQSLYAPYLIDLEPSHGEYLPVSPLPEVHVRFASAIVTAHSVLEDLGIEIRATTAMPSRIKGAWNPVVRADLEARLTGAGIDVNDPIVWTIRGPRRRLEARRPIPSRSKYPWSRGAIRDCEVELVDAIAHVDWLRDKVASHSVRDLTKSLSPYDVVNAQHLARRLILETLGFWT